MKGALRFGLVAVGLFLVLTLTLGVFGLDVPAALGSLWKGAMGDKFGVARTLVRATPMMLCGLGMVLAWRAGMYNIGGEGQYVVGGIAAAAAAKVLGGLPPAVLSPILLVSGAIGGGLYAAFAGWLHVKRGVQVVISTILLNFVALQILDYAVKGPLQEPEGRRFQTDALPDAAMLMRFDRQTDLHMGVFLAMAMVAVVAVYLFLTKSGFLLRVVGDSPSAARANRIDAGQTQVSAMFLSGALCGLAGSVDYVGLIGWIGSGFSQNWGFLAIPVALLGGLHPVGTGFSALFFGGLFAGSEELRRGTDIGNNIVPVIQGVAVLAYVAIFQFLDRKKRAKEAAE